MFKLAPGYRKRIQGAAPYIFFLVVAAFIGWIEFNSIPPFVRDRTASGWPSVQGVVLSHETCSPVYECGLSYSYRVNGKNYVGRRISFTRAHLPKSWHDEDFRKWAATKFQDGQPVNVSYKPDSPEVAVLQSGVLADSYLGTGVIMDIVMLVFLIVGLRGLKKSWTESE
jgi:hypothetical protein